MGETMTDTKTIVRILAAVRAEQPLIHWSASHPVLTMKGTEYIESNILTLMV